MKHQCPAIYAHEAHVWISAIAGGGQEGPIPQITLVCPGMIHPAPTSTTQDAARVAPGDAAAGEGER